MANPGFRIFTGFERPTRALVDLFRGLPTPNISDNMNRIFAVGPELRPIHGSAPLLGTAFTVRTRPCDNLMVHAAIDLAQPGDVLVVEAAGDTTNAIIGEIMARLAKKKGLAGYVIDGAVRDRSGLRELGFPVYAKGITHRGPYKDGPGEIGVTVTVGGAICNPGDVVVGDEDGVLFIPPGLAEEVAGKARAHNAMEARMFDQIEAGTLDRSWVMETLRKKGCEFLG